MAEERLEVRLDLKTDDAQRGLSSLAQQIGVFTVGLNEAVQLGKQFVSAVVGLAQESFTVWAKYEESVSKVNAVLQATGGAVGYTTDQLVSMASQMQSVTTFGDDMVLEAQAILMTFRDISGETFPKTIQMAADMASVFGMDLTSATRLLGKALNEPDQALSSLARVGVQFNAEQEKIIKGMIQANDKASAQAYILKELESRFGGVAEKMAQTSAGAMKQLQNSIDDLKKAFGSLIADAITPAIKALNDWVSALAKGVQATKNAKDAMKMTDAELMGVTIDQLQEYRRALQAVIESKRQMVSVDASGLLAMGSLGEELRKQEEALERINDELERRRRERSVQVPTGAKQQQLPVYDYLSYGSYLSEPSYDGTIDLEQIKALNEEYERLESIRSSYLEEPSYAGAIDLEQIREMNRELEKSIEAQSKIAEMAQNAENSMQGYVGVNREAIKQFETMIKLGQDLERGFIAITATGFVDQMRELGSAAYDAGLSLNNLGSMLASLSLQILNSLPQLFLQAGLQQIIAGNVGLGLALIAMAGVSAAVGGYATAAAKSEANAKQQPIAPQAQPNGAVVNIENNTNSQATYQERTAPDGTKIIDVVIGSVAGAMANGEFDGVLQSRYGARPKGVVR